MTYSGAPTQLPANAPPPAKASSRSRLPRQAPRVNYLDRLEDLVPAREAKRVRDDVEAMILDRVDVELQSNPALTPHEAETRAIAAMGSPEKLADDLAPSPSLIPQATRQAFLRTLALVIPIHVFLCGVLGVAGSAEHMPALLAPLPLHSWIATVLGVLAIVFMDVGAVLCYFWLRRGRKAASPFVATPTELTESRKDAWKGLAMVGLLGVLLNVFAADSLFVVRSGDAFKSFLADPLRSALPWLNIPLVFFGLRHLIVVSQRGTARRTAILFDALGCVSAAAILGWLCTRSPLVQFPEIASNEHAASVMTMLVTRIFLLCFAVGALLFLVRSVRSVARLHRASVR